MSRRITPLLLAAAAATLAGCGGSKPSEPAAPVADPAKLQRAFQAVAGAPLERSDRTLSSLQLRQYPSFELILPATAEERAQALMGDGGLTARRGSDGLYRTAADTAVKDYGGGVLLSVGLDALADEAAFARLDRAVKAAIAGRPEQVPGAERSCRAAGIDPARGKAGRCLLNGTPLAVADAAGAVEAGGIRVRLVGVRTASVLPSLFPDSGPVRTVRRYVTVEYRLTNTGPRPYGQEPELIVGSRTYAEDSTGTSAVDGLRPVGSPVQPGNTATLQLTVKVDPSRVRELLDEGQLAFTAGDELARIRLAGAGRAPLGDELSANG